MKHRTMSLAVLIATVTLAAGTAAHAQTQDATRAWADVNFGAQPQSRTIDSTTSFPLYGETAIINSTQSADGGPLFDISGGYKITPMFGVGVGFSYFSSSGDGALAASIPDPNVINRPKSVTAEATDLSRSEKVTHIMAVYIMPIDEKLELTLFGGPSFFRVSQDILTGTVPAGTQNLNTTTEKQTGSGTGGNVGANVNYRFRPNYGVGVFLRWSGASVDLPSAPDLSVGGFQLGGGVRLKF